MIIGVVRDQTPKFLYTTGATEANHRAITWLQLSQLGKVLLDGGRVGTDNASDELASLEKQDGWHGCNVVGSSDGWQGVNVDLVEAGSGVLSGKLLQHWSEHFARSTPCGKEVDNDEVGLGSDLLEFGLGRDNGDC